MISSHHSLSKCDLSPEVPLKNISRLTFYFACRKAAQANYLRNISHAWGDAKCVDILINARAQSMPDQPVADLDRQSSPPRARR